MTNHIVALFDSDTKEQLSADDLEITEAEYSAAVDESYASPDACGHVRVNGRRVYADVVGWSCSGCGDPRCLGCVNEDGVSES